MYVWRAKALQLAFAHAQDDLNLHILHIFKGAFQLDPAHIIPKGSAHDKINKMACAPSKVTDQLSAQSDQNLPCGLNG